MLTLRWKIAAVAAGLVVLAGCATPAPPPPPPSPPPPPPPVVRAEPIPYRPIPPGGAPYVMVIPGKNAAGQRITVNTGIDEQQAVWHFRSGWNVAALNCTGPDDGQIIAAYGGFLTRFERQLATINTALDARARAQAGSTRAGTRAREEQLTQVYNYFAQPAARGDFCAAARAISAQWVATPSAELNGYAVANLALMENAFEQFFTAYERYRTESAAWDARYGVQYGASQPGYVVVHGTPSNVIAPASMVATEGTVSTPVVQPVASTGNR
jgi:multidrug efflux pump subunit AcrA (membrane-fusion protein)